MAVDALPIERQKKFAYRMEINGFPTAAIQEVSLGSVDVGVSEHTGGGQNFDVKEAGKLKFGEITLKGVNPIDGPGSQYWQKWLDKIQDPVKGYGMRKKDYAQDCSIYDMYALDMVLTVWSYFNAWISKYDPGDRNSMSDKDDVIVSVTLVYDYRVQRGL